MERRALRRVDASPADVGRRITLRYRLDPLGLNHSEAAGVLDRWSGTDRAGILMLRRRDDTTVRIPFDSVEVARVLPPELSAYRMQELAEATWPPKQWTDLGTWRLRWAGPHAGRANSVRVAGRADRSTAAALREVLSWFQERGGAPLLQVPAPSPFDDEFESEGWPVVRRSRLMTSSTQRLLIATASARTRGDMVLTVSETPDEDWLTLLSGDDVGARAEIEPVLTAPDQVGFVSCRKADTGELLGIARGVFVSGWIGVNNMVTAPNARRRGVATAAMGALVGWGSAHGADRWFLRVHADSEAALSLYDSLGFTRHHDYVYRAPAEAAPEEDRANASSTDD